MPNDNIQLTNRYHTSYHFFEFPKKKDKAEKVKKDGILIDKKLLNNKIRRGCPVCDIYSFDLKDDLYMNKYSCCWACFMEFVEGREDRWKEGWRPDSDEVKQRRFNKK